MKKQKGNWRRCISAMLALALLLTMPGTVFGAGIEKAEWSYENSILVTVLTEEEKDFTTADFSVVDCKSVWITEKEKTEQGFLYELVLVLKTESNQVIENAIGVISQEKNVKSVQRNNKYATPKSTVLLNKSVVYLKTGETADVDIQNVNLVEKNIQNVGIAFLADPKVYAETTLEKGSFLKYGVSRFWPETEKKENILLETPDVSEATFNANGSYYGLVADEESFFEIVNDFAKVPGILGVSVVQMAVPGGEPLYENWNIKDTEIASLAVSGGEIAEGFTGSGPYVNQTARVQGLKQGVTTLTVERGGFGAYASDVCTVIVYEPGSTNNPGDLDHSGAITAEDALQTLKKTVGLISLDEDSKRVGDLNLDGDVNAEDALLMLKITVGSL